MKKNSYLFLLISFLLFCAWPMEIEASNVQDDIFYHILVDRFNNGDRDRDKEVDLRDPYTYHGGDFAGIIERLDTIKNNGFTAIILSPIMANAPDGYHGYWIEDFFRVEEQFGTMDDFRQLVAEAHDRDIKVILEFVMNYAADSHPLADDPEKADWYTDANDIDMPWIDGAIVLNQRHPDVRAMLLDAAKFWMDETDIDGFKLHAADQADPDFLKQLTEEVKERNSDFYVLADVLDESADVQALKDNPNIDAMKNPALFRAMNDVFIEVENPVTPILEVAEETPDNLLYVDHQYTKRFTQRVVENGRHDLTSWKLALTTMYTLPGAPVIFQGSEQPMYGEGFPESEKLVDFNSGDDDLREFFEKISAIRTEFPVLADGHFDLIGTSGAMSVFRRTSDEETIFVAINNDSESKSVVTTAEPGKQLSGLIGDNIVRENKDGRFNIVLPKETAEVYVMEEDTGFNWLFIGFVASVFALFVIAVIVLSRKQKKTT